MKRFGSLKKLKVEIQNIRKNHWASSVSINEEPATSDETTTESSEGESKLNFKDLLYSFICMNDDDDEVSVLKAYNLLTKVFEIQEDDALKIREEVETELKVYKSENITEHSLLLIELWKHETNPWETSVLTSHSKFKHLNETENAFAKWTAMNFSHDLDNHRKFQPREFNEILVKLTKFQSETGKFRLKTKNEDVEREFWKVSETFLRRCLEFIENLTEFEESSEDLSTLLEAANRINECKKDDSDAKSTFAELAKESLTMCLTKYLHVLETKSKFKEESNIDDKLNGMLIFIGDTFQIFKKLKKLFKEPFQHLAILNFQETLFLIFDNHLWKHFRSVINDVCKQKVSPFDRSEYKKNDKMLELFLEMKSFSNKGMKVVGSVEFKTLTFASWFSNEADHACDCPLLSAIPRISKAISLENYVPVDEISTHSSTAVDIVGLLDLVIKFWDNEMEKKHLTLKEESPAKFIKLVTSDVCSLVAIYLSMAIKIIDDWDHSDTFQLLKNICVLINNLNFVEKSLQSLIVVFLLKTDKGSIKLPNVVRRTLKLFSKMKSEILRKATFKATGSLKNQFQDESCDIVQLQKTAEEHFCKVLKQADCSCLTRLLHEAVINAGRELMIGDQGTQPSQRACQRVQKVLQNIDRGSKVFDDVDVTYNFDELSKMLRYSSLSTQDLIQEYFFDRYDDQQNRETTASDPALSVESYFNENGLVVNIWHGKNLVDKFNEPFESYVKFRLVPEDAFPTLQDMKTKVFKKTAFPLYEECFQKELTKTQRCLRNAVILFTVKDKNILNSNSYIGEAFLPFAALEDCTNTKRTSSKHLNLPLSKLDNEDLPSLKVLQQRSKLGDERAMEFLRKVDSIKLQPSPKIISKVNVDTFMKKLPAAASMIVKNRSKTGSF